MGNKKTVRESKVETKSIIGLVKKYLKRGNKIACSSKTCKYSRDMEE